MFAPYGIHSLNRVEIHKIGSSVTSSGFFAVSERAYKGLFKKYSTFGHKTQSTMNITNFI